MADESMQSGTAEASRARPVYTKVKHEGSATRFWFIVCDEGWRSSIVCEGMYEWAADWLLTILGNRPFASDRPSTGDELQPAGEPALDADCVVVHVSAGNVALTQTTGRGLNVAVNGVWMVAPDRERIEVGLK